MGKENKRSISRRIVKKSNNYVLSKYALTAQEQKIVLLCISKIKNNQDINEELSFSFNTNEIKEFLGYNSNRIYQDLHKISNNLVSKKVDIYNDELGKFDVYAPFPDTSYSNGEFRINFSKRLNPELINLKSKFTYYYLDLIKNLSTYSLRIYEILKSFQFQGKYQVAVEELKEMIGVIERDQENNKVIDKYKQYSDFKKRVLKVSEEEISNETDIKFTIKEIKIGKKVTELMFTIINNAKEESNEEKITVAATENGGLVEVIENSNDIDEDLLFERIDECRLFLPKEVSTANVKKLLETANNDVKLIKEKYFLSKKQKRIENLVGWLIAAILEDYQEIAATSEHVLNNRFTDFPQRHYSEEEYENLEQRLLNKKQ